MKWDLSEKALHSDLLGLVERMSGQNVSACYQCGKCSAGCPVVADTTVTPNRVIRATQLGLEAEALCNDMVWCCAGCGTCTGRCPEGIDIVRILDALRAIALRRGVNLPKGGVEVQTFYRAFLDSVRDFGRLSEVGLMGGYNINSGRLWTNMAKAPWFLLKGKVGVSTHKVRQLDRLQRVFERIEHMEQTEVDDVTESAASHSDAGEHA